MLRWLKKIPLLGISPARPYLQRQIILCNHVSLLFIAVAIMGMAISYVDGYIMTFYRYLLFLLVSIFILVLNRYHYTLQSRVILTFLPQFLIIIPPFIWKEFNIEANVEYFYALLGVSILPTLLFNKREKYWIIAGIIVNLLVIMTYDSVFGIRSTPTSKYEPYSYELLKFKFRQFMIFMIVTGGYIFKMNISSFFEEKYLKTNSDLEDKAESVQKLIVEINQQNNTLQTNHSLIVIQNEKLVANQREIILINKRLEFYTNTLMLLTKSKQILHGNFNESLHEITMVAAYTLKISRVSVWDYNKNSDSIICLTLFNSVENKHDSGMVLYSKDFPDYFKALKNEQIIDAVNTNENIYTRQLFKTYLKPLFIESMIDTPYFINGELGGVVCCEHQYEKRDFTAEDIFFAKSVADLVSLAYESAERKKAEEKIQLQKAEIVIKNEELQFQQSEIKRINAQLEQKVIERTVKLEEKNTKLQEYTYINSHLLRGPLCRILGIIYILENNLDADGSENIFYHLKESATELDFMVKKITNTLEEGVTFELGK